MECPATDLKNVAHAIFIILPKRVLPRVRRFKIRLAKTLSSFNPLKPSIGFVSTSAKPFFVKCCAIRS